MDAAAPHLVHGSAVALNARGVLFLGRPGSGKSTLALGVLAHGGQLIADDRTNLTANRDRLIAWSPETILGRIEARGIGILHADTAPPTALVLVVDLDQPEPDRIPPVRRWQACGISLPLLHGAGRANLLWGVIQYLKGGRADTP